MSSGDSEQHQPGTGQSHVDDDSEPGPGDDELLAAFDRLSPQGSLGWGFDDAMGRIAAFGRHAGAAAVPWEGLPDNLWERGRSARIGQRFVGDVAGVLAGILAADARNVTDTAVGDRLVAVWDALRYLAARVEILEGRVDPTSGLAFAADLAVPAPDVTPWVDGAGAWFTPLDITEPGTSIGAVLVGESADGLLLGALADAGHRVCGVEPRGELAWSSAEAGQGVVFGEVAEVLGSSATDSLAGAVLVGCIDRLDLSDKLGLLADAVRVIAPGGAIVLLVTDQAAWDEALPPSARDLVPGRPLHPETWLLLLRRMGVVEPTWHRPSTGSVHALVGTVVR